MKRDSRILIRGASGSVGSSAVQLSKANKMHVTAICSRINESLVRQLGADVVLDYSKKNYLDGHEAFDIVLDAVPAGARRNDDFDKIGKRILSDKGRYISVRKGFPKFSRTDLILLNEMFEAGALKAVVDRIYPLEQIVEAHAHVESWRKRGNVIVEIQTDCAAPHEQRCIPTNFYNQ